MLITLSNIKDRARARADMKSSSFVEDSELVQYINSSYQELYDLLVNTFEDYYTKEPVSFTIVSGTEPYTLPSDFYKLRGVDYLQGSNFVSIQPFSFADRNKQHNRLSYKILGNKLFFTPTTQASGTYQIWYIPSATTLNLDTDTLDGINGWEEYVVVDVARKCLDKEESDSRNLSAEKAQIYQRILTSAARRDAGSPKTITDIHSQGDGCLFGDKWNW